MMAVVDLIQPIIAIIGEIRQVDGHSVQVSTSIGLSVGEAGAADTTNSAGRRTSPFMPPSRKDAAA